MRTYKALQPDELTLEKTDILAVKTRTSDGENQAFPTALLRGRTLPCQPVTGEVTHDQLQPLGIWLDQRRDFLLGTGECWGRVGKSLLREVGSFPGTGSNVT